ncbi:MAG: FAD:protein FMN transferase [Anaerolineaceae bacterium]|nr:FAD:protein FMN transferase [Anaerolineaceae bacterium]
MMQQTIQFRAMGCQMSATLFSDTAGALEKLKELPDWFEEWEQVLSRFRADSELSLFNQHNGNRRARTPVFSAVLETALWAEQESDGVVTPRVLDALEEFGYKESFEMITQDQMISQGIFHNSMNLFFEESVDDEGQNNIRYDFGGVAKGWAAQQAVQRLAGFGPALVNAGGDIAISAKMPDGLGWIINVTDPFSPENSLATLRVDRGGVATSGVDFRVWNQGEVQRHHIINPQIGLPAESDLISVTIVAPSVIEAEMAAKLVLIKGSERGLRWLKTRPEYAAFLVFKNGEVKITETMRAYSGRSEW